MPAGRVVRRAGGGRGLPPLSPVNGTRRFLGEQGSLRYQLISQVAVVSIIAEHAHVQQFALARRLFVAAALLGGGIVI